MDGMLKQKVAKIKVENRQDYIMIKFTGDLEYGRISKVKKKLRKQLIESNNGYIIDTENVDAIDSAGFGMIVNFARKVFVKGSNIAIIVKDEFVRNLFSISKCDQYFPIVQSTEEGLKVLEHGRTSE